ncbi:MAG: alpha/beta fold hydrolase [Reyranella sp.]|uniref:alpha/beta fold hydrolase n=1 Tax=Reyranella sp. TaxID=1929291 RepID=UPI0025E264CA|nr:alpha/beta hydrolase [Reyranella sp.]MBR2813660.1 alpha/beta fold hydrolase [Reyranella sp.]
MASTLYMAGLLLLAAAVIAAPSVRAANPGLQRQDRFVDLPSNERLFVREVRRPDDTAATPASAVLLLHGARVPGLASFDLPVPGGSLAADLAAAGHRVYILDLRGYGKSSRPAAMEAPASASSPLMRTADAVADIAAAVAAIKGWTGLAQVSLLGWATGGHWLGAYAAAHPQEVRRLVVVNTLYGGSDKHPTLGAGSSLEDPKRPGTLNTAGLGGWRLNTRESLYGAWDSSIPDADKSTGRDPAVANAYGDAALASDETSTTRTPPSFRAPSGAMADAFELAMDRRQWRAADLAMPVLVIRSSRDFWSRPEDAATLAREAPQAELLLVEGATHFVHLDRASAGRTVFLDAVLKFLTD